MKLSTKIKLTKATGYIELILSIFILILSFRLDAMRIQAIIMGIIFLIIGFVWVKHAEYIVGGRRRNY